MHSKDFKQQDECDTKRIKIARQREKSDIVGELFVPLFLKKLRCNENKKAETLLLCVIESRGIQMHGHNKFATNWKWKYRENQAQIARNETINIVKLQRVASTACHYEPVPLFFVQCCIFHCLYVQCACLARYFYTCTIYCVCVFIQFRWMLLHRILFSNKSKEPFFIFVLLHVVYFFFYFRNFFVCNLYVVFGWCLCGNIEVENTKTKRGGWAREWTKKKWRTKNALTKINRLFPLLRRIKTLDAFPLEKSHPFFMVRKWRKLEKEKRKRTKRILIL